MERRKADSSLTTPEPTPKRCALWGPWYVRGPRALRMTLRTRNDTALGMNCAWNDTAVIGMRGWKRKSFVVSEEAAGGFAA
jgi:hypothetical protein